MKRFQRGDYVLLLWRLGRWKNVLFIGGALYTNPDKNPIATLQIGSRFRRPLSVNAQLGRRQFVKIKGLTS